MIKAISILAIGVVAAISAGCANGEIGRATAQSAGAQRN